MANPHLFDNAVLPWGDDGNFGSTYQRGNRFTVKQNGFITKLGFYRINTSSPAACNGISLWDGSGSRIAHTDAPTDDGVTGWQWTAVSPPVAVSTGQIYDISRNMLANTQDNIKIAVGNRGSPPWPFAFEANVRGYAAGNNATFPNTFDNYDCPGADVEWSLDGSASTGLTVGNLNSSLGDSAVIVGIQNDLAYLKTSVGAALATAVTEVDTSVDLIQASVGSGLNTIAADVQTKVNDATNGLAAIGGRLSATWATNLNNASNAVNSLLQTTSDRVATILNSASDGLVAVLNKLAGIESSVGRVPALPGTGWANTASTAWDTSLAWTEPADLYVVTVSDLGGNIVNTVVAGVDVSYRLAWWTPLDGDQPGGRRFVDTPLAQLSDGGRRMPGLLLHSSVGASGTVDAWIYTAP